MGHIPGGMYRKLIWVYSYKIHGLIIYVFALTHQMNLESWEWKREKYIES